VKYAAARWYWYRIGVSQNQAEAYKWYLIAARSGDGESRSRAQLLKAKLSAEALQMADRAAQAFHPETQAASAAALARPATSSGG